VVDPFIQLKRSKEAWELLTKDHTAFCLLTIVAQRAKRTDEFSVYGLDVGEALMGDYKSYGMSRQQYRSALLRLKYWDFLTIKPTTKGTIVKLINTDIFDINVNEHNQQANQRPTIKQPTANHQATTNKNVKKEKNERSKKTTPVGEDEFFNAFWKHYPKKQGKGKAREKWKRLPSLGKTLKLIIEALSWQRESEQWTKENGQFIPLPATYLDQERWLDQPTEVSEDGEQRSRRRALRKFQSSMET